MHCLCDNSALLLTNHEKLENSGNPENPECPDSPEIWEIRISGFPGNPKIRNYGFPGNRGHPEFPFWGNPDKSEIPDFDPTFENWPEKGLSKIFLNIFVKII